MASSRLQNGFEVADRGEDRIPRGDVHEATERTHERARDQGDCFSASSAGSGQSFIPGSASSSRLPRVIPM